MRSRTTKTIIRKIAEKENLTVTQVEEIVESFFKYVVKVMTGSDRIGLKFSDIRLLKFGTFKVSPAKRKRTEEFNNSYLSNEKSYRNKNEPLDNLARSVDDQRVQKNMG